MNPHTYFYRSNNVNAEGAGRTATAEVVNTSQANSIDMTSILNVKAPKFTLAGNIEVFLKKLDNYFDIFASLTDK